MRRISLVRSIFRLAGEKTLYTTPLRPYFPSSKVTRRLLLVRAAPWSNPTGGGPMRWTVPICERTDRRAKPDKPVIGFRPHAAGRAARWFLENFPGDVAYAYKANSSRVPAGRAVRRGHPAFRRRLAPRDRGRGDDPRRAPALHASGQVAQRHPAGVRRVRRAQLRARQRGRAQEDPGGDRRLPRPHPVGARGRACARTARSRSSASSASPAPRRPACW